MRTLTLSLLASLAPLGSCVCAMIPSAPEVVYHAAAGSCHLDVLYLDEDGEKVRRPRVRGWPEDGSHEPWTQSVELEPGETARISVVVNNCMRTPVCWITQGDAKLVPKTPGNPAVCEIVVPAP